MYRVELFENDNYIDLQKECNVWLQECPAKDRSVISLQTTYNSELDTYLITIFYKRGYKNGN